MTELKDIIAYYCRNYPHQNELSKARLTKLVYLADWKSAVDKAQQMTDIDWIYNRYGPYVDDVIQAVMDNEDLFEIDPTENYYGENKNVIRLKDETYEPQVDDYEKTALDRVIEVTQPKYWDDFISFVYGTYPIRNSEKFETMNLVELADRFKAERQGATS